MPIRIHQLLASPLFAVLLAVFAFLLIVGLGEVFISIQQREAETTRNVETVSYASTLRARVERELNALLFLSSGLGSYLVVRNDSMLDKEVNDILGVLYRSSQHVRNFGVAIGYRLTYVHPIKGNESAIGLYYPDHPKQWPIIQKIIANGTPALAGPVDLVQGGKGLIYRVPLFINGQYWGLLSTVINADTLFESIFEQTSQNKFTFALRSKGVMGLEDKAILGDQTLFQRADSVQQEIEVPGGHWVIAVQAKPIDYLFTIAHILRITSIFMGVIIAWLLYVLTRNRAELAHLVMFDTLTGLPNRRLLNDRHTMAMARHQRAPEHLCVLLFLDLDGFKKINDDYSHKAGDAVLREVAQRMRAITRANDTIARWGGDEFVILLEEISQETLDHLVERLRKKIELPIEHEGHLLRVGTSIGIAVYPNHPAELDEMLKIADKHMYHDKAHRKLQPSATIENSAKEG